MAAESKRLTITHPRISGRHGHGRRYGFHAFCIFILVE
jgi:hypothetical protein